MKYRKKPVVVEAVRTDRAGIVHTRSGDMIAQPGDYIITGIGGERYLCKQAIFEQAFEAIEEDAK